MRNVLLAAWAMIAGYWLDRLRIYALEEGHPGLIVAIIPLMLLAVVLYAIVIHLVNRRAKQGTKS